MLTPSAHRRPTTPPTDPSSPVTTGPTSADEEAPTVEVADESDDPARRIRPALARSPGGRAPGRLAHLSPARPIFTVVFARLGVQRHDTFGTWAFDLGIYDQGFWLVSRGKSFITVRGIDFWGHHVNLIAFAFAPFYWLGAGPAFLITVQAATLGAGAIPTYLIARDRLRSPWVALAFAGVYLMYAPIQWIAWANFHPEALVVTPVAVRVVVRHPTIAGGRSSSRSSSRCRSAKTRRWQCS